MAGKFVNSRRGAGASESDLIAAFARVIDRAGVTPKGLVLGVGDDAAVYRARDGEDLVVTKDAMVEGRHFVRKWFSGRDLGWRLAAVNLSDVAAMGATPRFALLSLVVPANGDADYLVDLVRGLVAHLARYGAALVGGNVASSDGPLVCDLTLTGLCRKGKAWRRDARPGDAIVVAGPLGNASAGLDLLRDADSDGGRPRGSLVAAFRRPEPRLDVAAALRGVSGVRGAIDVSDGLSTDVIHMCESSDVGCLIDADALPVSRALSGFCRDRDEDPVRRVLNGGEDYALILAVHPRRVGLVRRRIESETRVDTAIVGEFTRHAGTYELMHGDGPVEPFTATGWDHLNPSG